MQGMAGVGCRNIALQKKICAVLGLNFVNWQGVLRRKPGMKHTHTHTHVFQCYIYICVYIIHNVYY